MRRCFVLVALLVAVPVGAVEIEWVHVGDPGNPPDAASNCEHSSPDCGSVPYDYDISKYEVTNTQYAAFLNAKAASDPFELYNSEMGSDATFGGITRSSASGGYTYAVKRGFATKPVTYVSFYDALRFANWLNNGEATGDTETGAYTITPAGITDNAITRNSGAIRFLPSENEWYKAAYYSPGGVYFDYPTGTSIQTDCVAPEADTGNSANCEPYAYPEGSLTDVGAYALSDSPYGTYDQGGNVWEWNEQIVGSERGFRGGSWANTSEYSLAASDPSYKAADPEIEFGSVGFRVAAHVPEPSHALLLLTGGLVLVAARRERRA